ncbi:hypothetical protein AMAG_14759 [Allomyces macrogynus ATCC 38327]|uniref:DUF4246 domain-containing protein n=1 Tax=Allomyces macrogynus (strain ATCC 38327) TaxID=578462 RepID=A0A0L0T585_ALLM3|nr:hypothetical protein AMAG_14759 [Allomyces macrogynus ATCC 38327]|eukprot:KNE69910.1 hypothetical protein AMAG_14759 [Allomyces macrogynus ATCC 38327]
MTTTHTAVNKLLPLTSPTEGDDGKIAYFLCTRCELRMCQLPNAVRDMPDWARKWHTNGIQTKWTAELRTLAQQDIWTVGVILAHKPEDEIWWNEGNMEEVPLGPMVDVNIQAVLDELDFQAGSVTAMAGPNSFDKHSALVTPFSLHGRSLKVITMLANFHLTCDVDNITRVQAAVRSGVRLPAYEQLDDLGVEYANGLYNNGPLVPNRGFITARQGRLVAFSNLYLHHVAPFELADPTWPGHRKIIASFLVDPISPLGREIVMTAQVPPQQAEWIADAWAQDPTFSLAEKMPLEVLDMILERTEGSMTRKEAMALWLELMNERTDIVQDNDVLVFGGAQFSMCEH